MESLGPEIYFLLMHQIINQIPLLHFIFYFFFFPSQHFVLVSDKNDFEDLPLNKTHTWAGQMVLYTTPSL